MKRMRNGFRALMWVVLLGTLAIDASAQGRGRGNRAGNPGQGHDKEHHSGNGHDWDDKHRNDNHDRYHKDQSRDYTSHHNRDDYRDHNNRSHDYSSHHDRYNHHDHYVTYSHHRYGPPSWAPAYGYRYNTRYVYYRDYNVYYDCHRDVFITWTGRTWSISTRVPAILYSVDFRRAAVVGVEYWDDDFDFYLERRRPVYMSIRTSW